MVEKTRDVETKANLQLLFGTRKINSRYLRAHRLLVKKNKDNANREHRDRDKNKDKTKFHNLSSTNSQLYAQVSQKNKYRSH